MQLNNILHIAAIAAGFALDLLLGDPESFPHPVVFMGRAVSGLEKLLRKLLPPLLGGLVLAILLPSAAFALSFLAIRFLSRLSIWAGLALEILWSWQALAVRGMLRESRNVREKLAQVRSAKTGREREEALGKARRAVGRIVGRDTEALDEAAIARAAVETVAENFSDGVFAPLFYLMLGGAPLALAYKAVNTMDSMVGYKNERYLLFGRAAARLDDAMNFIPARLSAFLLILAARLCREDAGEAFRIWRRDRRKHESPNSAQCEAAMAGAIGLRLGGPTPYFGQMHEKPWLGDGLRAAGAKDILRAERLFFTASLLGLLLALASSSLPFLPFPSVLP